MSTFDHDNAAYERWLRRQCRVVEADLRAKHARMRHSAFDFLRATCFRWARTIERVCSQAGYRHGLAAPAPVRLDESGHGLRGLFAPGAKECQAFWAEVDNYKEASPPGPLKRALDRSLPKGAQVPDMSRAPRAAAAWGGPGTW